MLANGIIKPSESAWSSPIVLAIKKNGRYRFCIDLQKVNKVTRKDAHPLPYISVILDKSRHVRYISNIDLRHVYWQVPLTEDIKPITTLTVPGKGLYQLRVMPYRLHSAPVTFQRLMDRVIGPELEPYCFVYLEDIVLGKNFKHLFQMLKEVFTALRVANLRLYRKKCQLDP